MDCIFCSTFLAVIFQCQSIAQEACHQHRHNQPVLSCAVSSFQPPKHDKVAITQDWCGPAKLLLSPPVSGTAGLVPVAASGLRIRCPCAVFTPHGSQIAFPAVPLKAWLAPKHIRRHHLSICTINLCSCLQSCWAKTPMQSSLVRGKKGIPVLIRFPCVSKISNVSRI